MEASVETGCGAVSSLGVTAEGTRGQKRALTSPWHVGKGRTRETDGGERPGRREEEQAELRETTGVDPRLGARMRWWTRARGLRLCG